jgi:hypothetical protein
MPHPQTSDRAWRLNRLALFGRLTALGGIAVIGLYEVYLLTDAPALHQALGHARLMSGFEAEPSINILAWLMGLIPATLFLLSLWCIHRLFGVIATGGTLFSPDLPPLLHRLGQLSFAGAIAGLLTPTLTGLVLTLDRPPGQRQLVIAISSGEIAALIIGILMFAFAHLMQEALILEEDNRSIV